MIPVLIEGEPFLSRTRAWRDRRHDYEKAWSAFAEKHRATGWIENGKHLCFKNVSVPAGWTRPTGRHSASAPRKGSPIIAEMALLPKLPQTWEVFGEAVIYEIAYEHDGGEGWSSITYVFNGPPIGWIGDTFYSFIPDSKAAATAYSAQYPERKITNGADTWEVPAGLRRTTQARIDLMIAEAKVRAEEEASHD